MLSRAEITAPGLAPPEKLAGLYTIDPVHSTIGLSVRHAMITNMRAEFTAFEGLLLGSASFPHVATFRRGPGPEHGTGRRRGPDQRQGEADARRLRCPAEADRRRPEPRRDTR
ncbi:YceI family protein [Streptomyces mirabilis]|uniref:YceI family protein n=1 Tax=Streptomyces mirabilis TaxID=68239 RepID=UPI0036B75B16